MGLVCSKTSKKPAQVSPVNNNANNNIGQDKQPIKATETPQTENKENAPVAPIRAPTPILKNSTRPDGENNGNNVIITASNIPKTIKIGFLGTCESGKSTICQQARLLTKAAPHEMELRHRPAYIRQLLFTAMTCLLEHTKKIGYTIPVECQKYVDLIENNDNSAGLLIRKEEKEAFEKLWQEETIQNAYIRRAEVNMNDSVKYFFNNIHRFADLNFVPSQEDLVMLYVPTVGVRQESLEVNNQSFLIYDFSGRLMERKRWLSLYDTFDAIFYSIAISEFDQRFEDSSGKHSKLQYALDMFEQVCNEEKVKNVPIYVFLNETDVLAEKMERLELKAYFPDYNGSSEKDAVDFFSDYCIAKGKTRPGGVWVYPTVGINGKKTQRTLNDLFKKL
ncbi:unnamed protein product [Bursaphelenchus okinawaensis]|uniref:Uncharacterized protein n=1 Tax=Bursaphelenchus okinawaensis TaxID=465554 RepID=A0A811L5Y1_9BILA|nr:unnamed protein product [Bursaphelenchus okinawaensis]CAG9118130.1 unnamed protein product [Bursaphelenchus okinawaensis]